MGTKNNPGQFDCYTKAAADEPLFTLRGKDPVAPYLVNIWVATRLGEWDKAIALLTAASFDEAVLSRVSPEMHIKLLEALQCAIEMRSWRHEQVGGEVDG